MLNKAKITTEKIVFYPTLTEIITDLYKFVYGFELIGNDLQQIMGLINYYAAPIGYRFSNSQVSQSDLLSNLFDNSIFSKKPNCSKLEEVTKTCKVSYGGSSFCLDTAIAVARSLVVLSNSVK